MKVNRRDKEWRTMRRYLVSAYNEMASWSHGAAARAADFDQPPLFLCVYVKYVGIYIYIYILIPPCLLRACSVSVCVFIACAECVCASRKRYRAMIMGDVWLLLPEPCATQTKQNVTSDSFIQTINFFKRNMPL